MKKRRYKTTRPLKLLSIIVSVVVWQAVSMMVSSSILPGPVRTVQTLIENGVKGILFNNLLDTMRRVFFGFLIALISGTFMGVMMGMRKIVDDFFDYMTMMLLSIPSLCWAILGLMWFGLNETAVVFVIAAIGYPMVVINVNEGVKNVDKSLLEMAKVYHAHTTKVITSIIIPSIMPYLIAGSRYGIGVAWKIAIIAEMLGMSSGVGYQLNFYYSLFRMDQVLAWTLLFTISILLVDNILVKGIEGRVMAWRPVVAQ